MNTALILLLAAIAASCILCIAIRRNAIVSAVMPACTFVLMVLCMVLCIPVLGGEIIDDGIFWMDPLSAVFMMLVAVVGFVASVYSRAYISMDLREHEIDLREHSVYYPLLMVFISVMMLTFTARSMAVVWLGVGATTLVSTFLVGLYRREESTEAAWKYIILCSVGITIALFGLTLVYASTVGVIDSGKALDWPQLMMHASELDPNMMRMATLLIIIGFGTKVGFVPMHTWLPDAHSQAPSPISGLLSAVLLNCAMYAVLRFYGVSELVDPGFASTILLIFGFVSLAAASLFIISAKDLKRMLAYSSIENMGLIAIGLGIGTHAAIAAALIQMTAHSITKPILFFSAGNIIQAYGTRSMSKIRGVRKTMPFTSVVMAAGTLAIIGCPPFAVFVGELSIMIGALDAGMVAAVVLMVILLSMVFAGMVRNIFPMLSGEAPEGIKDLREPSRVVPIAVLLILTLALGLFMPDAVADWFSDAASVVEGVFL